MSMETVVLRNGAVEAKSLVEACMEMFESMINDPVLAIAIYEGLQIAKDPAHRPFGETGEVLERYQIIDENGKMHASIRNVLMSSLAGEGLDLRLVNPVKAEGERG